MEAAERVRFVRAYTNVLLRAYSDESFMRQLTSDPKGTLSESGIDTGDAAVQVVIFDPAGTLDEPVNFTLDEQVDLWEEGLASGSVTLHVPAVTELDITGLSATGREEFEPAPCCSSICCSSTGGRCAGGGGHQPPVRST